MGHLSLSYQWKRVRRSAAYRVRRTLNAPEKALYRLGLRSADSLTLPEFLIVGVPKAGTTWLHRNLNHHPAIHFPEERDFWRSVEIHYFDMNFTRPVREYAGLFAPHSDKIQGDKSPSYCKIPRQRIQFIHTIMPDVKIVFMLRNPIEREWSHTRMKYITLGDRALEEVPEDELKAAFRRSAYADTLGMLANWEAVFPPEQLFIGFYEDVAERPLELLQKLCTFVGASTTVDWSTFPYREVVFQSPPVTMPTVYRQFLRDLYRDQIERLAARFGDPATRWLEKDTT